LHGFTTDLDARRSPVDGTVHRRSRGRAARRRIGNRSERSLRHRYRASDSYRRGGRGWRPCSRRPSALETTLPSLRQINFARRKS